MPQWRFIGKDGKPRKVEPLSFGPGGEPVRYPFLPFGTYVSPDGDYFEIGPEHAREMIGHLQEGLPNALGIPGDERQDHSKNPDGAYSFARDLQIDEDALYATIHPTSEGLAHLDALPYISPNFWVGEAASPEYGGRRNFVAAYAHCSSPWFYGQPGMTLPEGARVMASMSTVGGNDAGHGDTNNDAGGAEMKTIAELEAQIAEMAQAAAAAATAHETALTEKATEVEALQTQLGERDAQITELTQRAETAEQEQASLTERVTKLETAVADKDREARVKAIVDEIGATVLEDKDEHGEVTQRQYAPEAVQVLAALRTDPGEAASQAFAAHLKDNGGKLATVPLTNKPALQVRAAMGGDSNFTDDQKLAALPDGDADRLRRLMNESSCGFEQAKRMDWARRRGV